MIILLTASGVRLTVIADHVWYLNFLDLGEVVASPGDINLLLLILIIFPLDYLLAWIQELILLIGRFVCR